MKTSEEPPGEPDSLDLVFPDWSGMDDSSARVTPEAAFRLCELYPQLLAAARKNNPEPRPKKSLPAFVL